MSSISRARDPGGKAEKFIGTTYPDLMLNSVLFEELIEVDAGE